MKKILNFFIRAWSGEISLSLAFWGIGLLGLFPLLGASLGLIAFIALRTMSLPVVILSLTVGLAFTYQSVSIWRSARHSQNIFGKYAARTVVFASWAAVFLVPPALLLVFAFAFLTPEHYVNADYLREGAPNYFTSTTGLALPHDARIAQVAWYRIGEEFGHQLVLDASGLDLENWRDQSRPFGKEFSWAEPEASIEFDATGLVCEVDQDEDFVVSEDDSKFVKAACELVESPKPVWMAQNRVRMDWMQTLIVDEESQIIWLQETEW